MELQADKLNLVLSKSVLWKFILSLDFKEHKVQSVLQCKIKVNLLLQKKNNGGKNLSTISMALVFNWNTNSMCQWFKINLKKNKDANSLFKYSFLIKAGLRLLAVWNSRVSTYLWLRIFPFELQELEINLSFREKINQTKKPKKTQKQKQLPGMVDWMIPSLGSIFWCGDWNM